MTDEEVLLNEKNSSSSTFLPHCRRHHYRLEQKMHKWQSKELKRIQVNWTKLAPLPVACSDVRLIEDPTNPNQLLLMGSNKDTNIYVYDTKSDSYQKIANEHKIDVIIVDKNGLIHTFHRLFPIFYGIFKSQTWKWQFESDNESYKFPAWFEYNYRYVIYKKEWVFITEESRFHVCRFKYTSINCNDSDSSKLSHSNKEKEAKQYLIEMKKI